MINCDRVPLNNYLPDNWCLSLASRMACSSLAAVTEVFTGEVDSGVDGTELADAGTSLWEVPLTRIAFCLLGGLTRNY